MKKPIIILLLCILIFSCKEKPLFKQVITIDGFVDTIRINEHGQVDIANHWRDPAVTILADTAFNERFHPNITTYEPKGVGTFIAGSGYAINLSNPLPAYNLSKYDNTSVKYWPIIK